MTLVISSVFTLWGFTESHSRVCCKVILYFKGPLSNTGPDTCILPEGFHGFPQCLQSNGRTVNNIRPRSLFSTFLLIRCYREHPSIRRWIILPVKTTNNLWCSLAMRLVSRRPIKYSSFFYSFVVLLIIMLFCTFRRVGLLSIYLFFESSLINTVF
jgi:hypothetical protein